MSLEVLVESVGTVAGVQSWRQRVPDFRDATEKLLPFHVVSKYQQYIAWFCHEACVTDGRTDRQNYDSQDRASITARAVKALVNQEESIKAQEKWRLSCFELQHMHYKQ